MDAQLQPAQTARPQLARLNGLDSIRFLCALIVVFAHTGQPPLRDGIDVSHPLGRMVDALVANIWSSAAAVIAFFVISGLCIHYAYAAENRIPRLSEYYTRRYVRILMPALAAIALSAALGLNLSLFNDSILWSVVAEVVYYTIYPLLLIVRRRLGSWAPLILVAFGLGFCVAATKPLIGEYPKFGLQLNWLLGLPCWLLGCWLADLIATRRLPNLARFVWPMRGAVWAAMILCSVLRYHTVIGYPWSLNLFAIVVAIWLGAEVGHFSNREPPRWMEWCGRWSYSLYLTHKMGLVIFLWLALPDLGTVLGWSVRLAFLLASAYLFYLICEKPAHSLARWAGGRLR